MDVTTHSFRQLVLNRGGIGMVVTPMVFVQQMAAAPKTVIPHLELLERQRPLAIQMVASGRNRDHIKTSLDFLSSYSFDILDINGGCPAAHTMQSGGGGGLLRDFHSHGTTERLKNILDASNKYSPVPVSLKTRLGYEDENDILTIAPRMEKLGIAFLTLHGRTVKQKYGGSANYQKIREVKELLSIPVVGNGDVANFYSYAQMKAHTQCDAVMIGRAAMFDPLVFRRIEDEKQTFNAPYTAENVENWLNAHAHKLDPPLHSITDLRQILQEDLALIEAASKFWNTDRFKLAELRRLAIWLIKGIPGYKKVRETLSKFNDYRAVWNYAMGPQIEDDLARSASHDPPHEDENPFQ